MKSNRIKRKDKDEEQISHSLNDLLFDKKQPTPPPRRDLMNNSQTFSSGSEKVSNDKLHSDWDEAYDQRKSPNPSPTSNTNLSAITSPNSPIPNRLKELKDSERSKQSSPNQSDTLKSKKVIRVTSQNAKSIIDKYDTFLFDMDGVLWQGNKLIQNSIETIQLLKDNNKQIYFVTNNSTKSRTSYVKKLKKLGLEIDKNHCFGSASMTALFLQHCKQFNCDSDKVYVIGESGILNELDDVGIQYVYDHVLPVPDDLNDIIIKPDPSIKVYFTYLGCDYGI
eukprot:NODE_167_length_14562_cov_0.357256.p8 type:complete len:280 gc:universal NODE_167_length_14562_cov_0.357256:1832-993(-)